LEWLGAGIVNELGTLTSVDAGSYAMEVMEAVRDWMLTALTI
jgi:hypothetical protein